MALEGDDFFVEVNSSVGDFKPPTPTTPAPSVPVDPMPTPLAGDLTPAMAYGGPIATQALRVAALTAVS